MFEHGAGRYCGLAACWPHTAITELGSPVIPPLALDLAWLSLGGPWSQWSEHGHYYGHGQTLQQQIGR